MNDAPLGGKSILVLEDEFLIAMDVEQMCSDAGAADILIIRTVPEAEAALEQGRRFDAAIVDVMLAGRPTLDFARRLGDAGIPFVFATGYAENEELATAFPGVAVVSKPYAGHAIVSALTETIRS